MSSLAAARADNFYFDPERFDPKKRGRDGYNALANSHPLGERAKRLKSEGILIIRFEMPLDAWCLKCNEHCARGVRFNAEKKKTGNYFSTPIYEFRMTCPSCSNEFVIKTDPQNSDYIYESGLRKKVREYSSAANETLKLTTAEVRERLATDPIFKLEHQADDKRKAKSEEQRLADIAEGQELSVAAVGAVVIVGAAQPSDGDVLSGQQHITSSTPLAWPRADGWFGIGIFVNARGYQCCC